MSIEFKPVKVTETDTNKQERVPWVKEAIAATKEDLKKLTYEVNPFIKKVEGKEYWEYDIGKVKGYLEKLQKIEKFQDIAQIDWEKTRGAYTVKWIMAVQIALKALWVAPDLTIDWVLATHKNFSSSETVKAIMKFQGDNKLDVTGVPYAATINKLLEKLGGTVTGAVSESTGNGKDATGQIIQQPWKEKIPSQKKITNEQFISEVITPFKEDSAFKPEQISAIENKLKNYLKNEDISKYQQFDSEKGANGKGYLSMDGGSEFWIGTFKDGKFVDGIKVLANGNVEEVKNTIAASEVLSASQMFEQSPIGKTFKKLSESAAWLSNELVQAWKKQAENYFKDKNPQEYQKFSSLDWDGWKGYYYDPGYKDIQIGTFKNKLLQEGIVLQNDKVLFITWWNQTGEQPLFEKQPPQKDTQWNQVEVSEKTDEELTKEVINFFSQADPKNPQTTIFATLARWNGKDFEELGRVLSKLSLDGLTGKTSALRELMRNLNQIVTILNQNKRFMLFNGAQRKNDVLEQITGIISEVWGIPEGEIESFKDLAALVVPPSKGTSASSSQNEGTPDKKDQANGVVPPQPKTKTTQEKNLSKLERQKRLAAEKAKKEAERKAQELAEREKKAAEKRKQEEEKKKRLQKEKVEDDTQKQEKQTDKPSEKQETATASKEFTIYSKLKDLGTIIGQGPNLKFVFNEGVLQTDGNGEYILMDGEKYYDEKHYENNDQKRDLKYFYVTTNTTAGVKIQFWKVEGGYVQPDFELVSTPEE